MASVKALNMPETIRSTKKPATMMGDISCPDGQQPRSSGQPAVPAPTPEAAVTPRPPPPRVSRERRVLTRDVYVTGVDNPHLTVPTAIRVGFNPRLAAPLAGGVGRGEGRRGQRRGGVGRGGGQRGDGRGGGGQGGDRQGEGGQGGDGQDNRPSAMLNNDGPGRGNGCFAASGFLLLVTIRVSCSS